jgi:nucleoside 2-deoxyribosyltransferase
MMAVRKKVYLAGPLFNPAERARNVEICEILERKFKVFLPQRDGFLIENLIQDGVFINEAKLVIFNEDVEAIRSCDILLIVLEGRSIDEGACFELGLAYGLGKVCWGLKSDPRVLFPFGDNPMIEMAISRYFTSTNELAQFIAQ